MFTNFCSRSAFCHQTNLKKNKKQEVRCACWFFLFFYFSPGALTQGSLFQNKRPACQPRWHDDTLAILTGTARSALNISEWSKRASVLLCVRLCAAAKTTGRSDCRLFILSSRKIDAQQKSYNLASLFFPTYIRLLQLLTSSESSTNINNHLEGLEIFLSDTFQETAAKKFSPW